MVYLEDEPVELCKNSIEFKVESNAMGTTIQWHSNNLIKQIDKA